MALPKPQPGLVISYSYLWRREAQAGQVEGRKSRPCAVVLVSGKAGTDIVTVVPITHSPPVDPAFAIEIPVKVKQHLCLDEGRSWIVLDEANEFAWPGYDLNAIPGNSHRYDYGFLPPNLFIKVIEGVLRLRKAGRGASYFRDV